MEDQGPIKVPDSDELEQATGQLKGTARTTARQPGLTCLASELCVGRQVEVEDAHAVGVAANTHNLPPSHGHPCSTEDKGRLQGTVHCMARASGQCWGPKDWSTLGLKDWSTLGSPGLVNAGS